MYARFRMHHLASLEHLLEAVLVALHLLAWRSPEQLRGQRTGLSARRVVAELDVNLRAAPSGCGDESNRASVGHLGGAGRAPSDELVRLIVHDLGIPFHAR